MGRKDDYKAVLALASSVTHSSLDCLNPGSKMKKIIIALIQITIAFSSVFAAKKATERSTVILDWQYRDEGEGVPAWVKAASQSDRKTVAKELGLEDYKVWVATATDKDLEVAEFMADTSGISCEISQTMSASVKETGISENDITERNLLRVMELVSESNLRGLQKVESFWIKNGYAKKPGKKAKKEDDYIVKYNYYSVWIMEKDLYEIQLKEFFSEK